ILALLPLLATSAGARAGEVVTGGEGHAKTWVEGLPPWGEGLAVVAAVALVVLGGRYLLQPMFRFIARAELRELFTAASLLLVIGTAMLMTKVGVSAALGTFLAGVVLARSEFRHQIEADIEPFKGLLLGLFFISVGAAIDFELITARPVLILELMVALIVVKFVVLFLLGRVFKMGLDQNLLFAFSLAQGGEFAFVLFSFSVQHQIVDASLASMLIAVVALTMAATPVLMVLNERLVQPRFGTREVERRPADEIDETNPVIIAGYGSFGSIVGRLLLANGIGTTVLEIDSDQVDLLRKLGLKVFYGDASRADLLQAAGAAEAKLLVVAVEEHDKARRIVELAARDFPHLKVLVRVKNRREAYDMIDLGVDQVFRDKLDSSLRLGVEALRLLGVRAYRAMRMAQKFRRHDERSVRDLAALRHEEKVYINEARRRIQDLERLLLDELDDSGEDRDAGWDTESLREEYGGRTEVASQDQ
ncbi:MAG: cation:proton antiporter, partial [Acidobacteriota bacterium]